MQSPARSSSVHVILLLHLRSLGTLRSSCIISCWRDKSHDSGHGSKSPSGPPASGASLSCCLIRARQTRNDGCPFSALPSERPPVVSHATAHAPGVPRNLTCVLVRQCSVVTLSPSPPPHCGHHTWHPRFAHQPPARATLSCPLCVSWLPPSLPRHISRSAYLLLKTHWHSLTPPISTSFHSVLLEPSKSSTQTLYLTHSTPHYTHSAYHSHHYLHLSPPRVPTPHLRDPQSSPRRHVSPYPLPPPAHTSSLKMVSGTMKALVYDEVSTLELVSRVLADRVKHGAVAHRDPGRRPRRPSAPHVPNLSHHLPPAKAIAPTHLPAPTQLTFSPCSPASSRSSRCPSPRSTTMRSSSRSSSVVSAART